MNAIQKLLLFVTLSLSQLVTAEDDGTVTKICHDVANAQFPLIDQTFNKNDALNPQCKALDYYYGIACKVDFEKARFRAYQEMKNKDDIYGSIVLTMLYANGEGIGKNIILAQKLACKNSFALAELTARILHLAQLNKNSQAKKFNFCDDITSGYMAGHCAKITEKISAAKREARLQHIVNQWPLQQRLDFTKLQKQPRNLLVNEATTKST